MYESLFLVLLLLISLLVPYEILISLKPNNQHFHFPLHLKSDIDAYQEHVMRQKKHTEKASIVRKIAALVRKVTRNEKNPIS